MMIKSNKLKNLVLVPLLIISLVGFNFSAFPVLAEGEDPDNGQPEEIEPYCGDGNLDDSEVCDEGEGNGVECTPEYGLTCQYCSAQCETVELQGPYCGDSNLDSGEGCELGSEEACSEGYTCNLEACLCEEEIIEPFCGDGIINGDEACEYDEDCAEGMVCLDCSCLVEEVPEPEPEPEPECIDEVCDNDLDDDCDGVIDEEDSDCQPVLPCEPEEAQACDTGLLGACAGGTQTCSQETTWGECLADNNPVAEICDNQIDDDCDGEVDCADTDCAEDAACSDSPPADDGLEGEGEGDDEEVTEECEGCQDCCADTLTVVNEDEAEVENDVEVISDTGSNSGGTIETGDATATANIVNTVNTNFIGSGFKFILLNIFENLFGDLNLGDFWNTEEDDSTDCNLGFGDCLEVVDITNNSTGTITNDVDVVAATGENSASNNQGSGSVTTGNANASANIANLLNTNIVGSDWLLFFLNVSADWFGDLIFPGKGSPEGIEEGAVEGESTSLGGTDINVENDSLAIVDNSINVTADTGGNTANSNYGGSTIETGDATAVANSLTLANTNIFGSDWLFIAINILGDGDGDLFSLPDGVAWIETPTGIILFGDPDVLIDESSGNLGVGMGGGAGSLNGTSTGANNSLNVTNNSAGMVINNVNVTAVSGRNEASGNSGSGTITTGDAQAAANILNLVNTNIIGRNWLLALINIFGDWQGDLAFGRPDLGVAESAITSHNPAQAGGFITYTLSYFNNGDADATEVTIVDDFDESYLAITDSGSGLVIENPGEIEWDIGEVPVGGSGSVSYSVQINPDIPEGTSYITNQSTIDSFEDDWNDEDNADTLSIEVYKADPRPPRQPGFPIGLLPDLKVEKTSNVEEFVSPGETVDYEIVLTNFVLGSAHQVVVEDILYNEDSEIINSYSWELGEVYGYEEITIAYEVAIGEEIPVGFYTNIAQARGLGGNWGNEVSSPEASCVIEVRMPGGSDEGSGGGASGTGEAGTGETETEEPAEEVSLEDIAEQLEEIAGQIVKIGEEIERISPQARIKTFVKQIPEVLVPEALAQAEGEVPAEEAAPQEGLERFLAAIGGLFSNLNPFDFLVLFGLLLLMAILLLLSQKKKEAAPRRRRKPALGRRKRG